MAATAGTGAIVAGAAVPAFPNNVVVFPDRDFVSIEGYQDHVGQTALLEILRDGQVIGSAKSAVAAGDVAFEINHPGGVCWGAGTGVNVTPDIRPGDTARISFDGEEAGETTVGNTFVTGDSVVERRDPDGEGHYRAGRQPRPDGAAHRRPGSRRHRDRPP